eukprot:jgi/Bigna1/75699/fgenesh1_pg.36_\
MPKKNKKDAKQVKGEVLYTDPEQIRAQLEFKKEMGQAVYDEIGTAYEEVGYKGVKDDYRDMALADLKDKGVDITKGRVDQQVDQWRADNIKPREALAIMWKRLGRFMFTDDELEEQLFMFKRPKATFPKNDIQTSHEGQEATDRFISLRIPILYQQIFSFYVLRGVGDGKSNGITPDQLKFALTELQGKFKGNPMSEEQIEEFLKVANVRKNTEQYAPLIECLEISTKIVNTISGDGGSKKKKKKGKKKK